MDNTFFYHRKDVHRYARQRFWLGFALANGIWIGLALIGLFFDI